jgi:DNA-directed RNA polymerase subunit RPC12/RpoP
MLLPLNIQSRLVPRHFIVKKSIKNSIENSTSKPEKKERKKMETKPKKKWRMTEAQKWARVDDKHIIGATFGSLVVVGRAKKAHFYVCRCAKCGKEVTYEKYYLFQAAKEGTTRCRNCYMRIVKRDRSDNPLNIRVTDLPPVTSGFSSEPQVRFKARQSGARRGGFFGRLRMYAAEKLLGAAIVAEG